MAGESPDRSKQRESSAEPTSGSAGSVPEARDPRVAVSREKDSSGGSRVDTATKVLSIRGARPTAGTDPAEPEAESSTTPDEDNDLRTAVSAWVRGAETPKPSPATPVKSPAPAEPDPTSTESLPASAGGQDTVSGAPTGKQAGAPEAGTAAGAAAGAGTAAGAKAGADAEAGAGDRSGAKADAEAKAIPKRRAGAKAPSKAPSKAASRAKTAAKTGTAPEATGTAEAKAAPDAEVTVPKTRTEGTAGTTARPGAKAQAGASRSASKGEAADADAVGVRAGATEDVAEADSTGTKPKAAVAVSAGTEDGPATSAAKDEPKTTDAADDDATDSEDRPEAAAAKAKPADAGPAASDAEDEPKAAATKGEPAVTDAKDEPSSLGVEGESEAVTADDEPEAADGGEDPQGPPAADDESRAGGAGGKSEPADGEAEAGGEAGAGGLDQATAVFKAVRPKKPAVDQPTTMLKLGGKPKPPESESERTSKFVALRDDMRPAAKANAPATAPEAAAPAPTAASDATTTVPQVGPERTTQQPLPPKPPLDLLAELTNTPPPPETPVRTLVRRVKIWTPLVLLLVIVVAVVQAFRPLPPPALALTAEDGYTFDGDALRLPWPGEGQGWVDVDGVGTMGHFGKQTPVAIGSVAKTMTAYIVLRDHPLKRGQEGPKIKVDAKAEKEGGYDKDGESTLNTVKAGDHLTEKQALSAVMIPSANNVARLLARWDAGSEAAFVKKMNATARQLGMTGTTYTDPSGLKETTVSTAQDQVKLGRAVVKVPALVDITSAASWTDPSGHNWPNYNELPYRIGAIGIKTGTTTAAGGNLLFASRKQVGGQTVTVVGAILDQQKPPILTTANEVSKTALLAAQKALTPSRILKKGDVVGYVDDQLGGRTPVVVTRDVSAVGWSGLKVSLSFTSGTVPHTAKAGTQVGSLTVGDGSAGAVKVPVALAKNLAEPGLGAKLTRIG
ncbi:D-alanyl-D-alanine carboxypeptidase [Streptomyces sp. NPDC028722]|uniref:D-alanyl-D-alanine carboxypeptidase n=1 Tax=Streptomyces sp. NPDC028722 TaxID=3155016 RepID=UPI0033D41247